MTAPVLKAPAAAGFGLLTPSPALNPKLFRTVARSAPSVRSVSAADENASGITLDGTLNTDGSHPVQPDSTGTYTIDAAMGRQAGANLFESFGQFNLSTGQTANFTGPATVQNLFIRVTGGYQSAIDGQIRCTIPSADFYLMNPGGVVFNQNASITVQGALTLTTADAIRFANGGLFASQSSGGTSQPLFSQNASGFVFASSHRPERLVLSGLFDATAGYGVADPYHPSINPAENARLVAVAGDIQVTGGNLAGLGGNALIASVGSAGEVDLVTGAKDAGLSLNGFTNRGTIRVNEGGALGSNAFVDSRLVPGNVCIYAGQIIVDSHGQIASDGGQSPVDYGVFGGTLSVNVTGDVTVNDATIGSLGVGSGTVQMSIGGDLFLQNGGSVTTTTVKDYNTPAPIQIQARNVLLDRGFIGGGNITVRCQNGTLSVIDGGSIETEDPSVYENVLAGTIVVDGATSQIGTSADDYGTGGGPVSATANKIIVRNGAFIGSDGFYSSGQVVISANDVAVDGMGSEIGSSRRAAGISMGAGGPVTIDAAGAVSVTNGGFIGSAGAGSGAVTIRNAQTVVVDGVGSRISSTDVDGPEQPASAGDILISSSRSINITNGAQVETSSANTAGMISITSGNLLLDGLGGTGVTIGIVGTVPPNLAPGASDITLSAGNSLQMTNQAAVVADSSGSARAGSISVSAASISMNQASLVSARALDGNLAGQITITANSIYIGGQSRLTADSYQGSGSAGTISIHSQDLALDGGASITAAGGGGLANALAIATNFDVPGMPPSGSLVLTSPQGTHIILDQMAKPDMSLYLDNPGGNLPSGFNGGFQPLMPLAAFTSNDLNGTWNLSWMGQPSSDPYAPPNIASLHDWSIYLGSTQIGASASPRSGLSFGSPLVVSNAFPGLTTTAGGNIAVNATNVQISGGSTITTSTLGTGRAGSVKIDAKNVLVSAAGSAIQSQTAPAPIGVDANTGQPLFQPLNSAAGDAGSIILNAGQGLTLQSGAAISSTAATSGGGNISIAAPVVSLSASRISGTALRAGGVSINSGNITLADSSTISTDTTDPSPTGSDITLAPLQPGAAKPMVAISSGSAITASSNGSGNAGSITVDASNLGVFGGSKLASASTGAGNAGSVSLMSGGMIQIAGSTVSAASSGSGAGGSIRINAGSSALLSAGAGLTTSTSGAGGNISVDARRITIDGESFVSANAGQDGNVSLNAPGGTILVRDSTVSASATQRSGAGQIFGQITIDPTVVLLENSTIDGQSAGKPVQVKFDPSVTLLQSNSSIRSMDLILPPTIDLTGSLAPLVGGLVQHPAQLEPLCGLRFGGSNISSFIVTGRGGEPDDPSGLQSEFDSSWFEDR